MGPTTTIIFNELQHILISLIGGARYGVKIRLPHAFVMTFLFRNDLKTVHAKLQSILRLTLEHATNLATFVTIYKSLLAIFKYISIYYINHHANYSNNNNEQQRKGFWNFLGRTIITTIVNGPFPGERSLQNAVMTSTTARIPTQIGHPEHSHHALLAGAIGGYIVWGKYSSVNYQIVLYLTSRVLVGVWKRYIMQCHSSNNNNNNTSNEPNDNNQLKPTNTRLYSLAAATVWGIVMMLFEDCPEVLHPSLTSSMNEIYRFQMR